MLHRPPKSTRRRSSAASDKCKRQGRVLVTDRPAVGTAELFATLFADALELDEKTLRMQRRGELSITARVTGEEAVSCGSAAALAEDDWCFPSYRQTPAALFWGGRLDRAIAGLMGTEPETIDEHLPVEEELPVSFTPVYVPLAVNVTNAVGSAMVDSRGPSPPLFWPTVATLLDTDRRGTGAGFHRHVNG
jgi:hypothetical protein